MLPCSMRRRSCSGEESTSSIWSALRTTQSGTRSRTGAPGHVLDLVGDALEVLDVDRGDDVDSGGEDVHDVLPALVVLAGSRNVRVGELVDQGDLGPSSQHRVEIHLLQAASPVVDHLARDDLKAVDQLLGELPSVALDQPDDDVSPPPFPRRPG